MINKENWKENYTHISNEVIDNEKNEDYQKFAAINGNVDLDSSVFTSIKKRAPWLILLLFLGFVVSIWQVRDIWPSMTEKPLRFPISHRYENPSVLVFVTEILTGTVSFTLPLFDSFFVYAPICGYESSDEDFNVTVTGSPVAYPSQETLHSILVSFPASGTVYV